MKKKRVDLLLVERGLVETRTKAQALIMAGCVTSGSCAEHKIHKAGHLIQEDTPLQVKGTDHPWVSRGGVKLAYALDHFPIRPDGTVCLDIGSSTGGFTDVLLARGARLVYAVDSGTNQLAWKLRTHPQVCVMENTNARFLTPDVFNIQPGIIVCDVSFISLQKVLPPALNLVASGACLVALIKPQFEAKRGEVGKGGIISDPAIHKRVCDQMCAWLNSVPGWTVSGLIQSPITGTGGNSEFLLFGEKRDGLTGP